MMILQDLPNATISQILRLVDNPTNCSVTSRWFHEVAEPVLYSKFVERHSTNLSLFIRTIDQTPRLAKQVKVIELNEPGGWNPHRLSDPIEITPYEGPFLNLATMLLGFFTNCADEMERMPANDQVSVHMSRMACDPEDNWDILASVLPMILPNLEVIKIVSHTADIQNMLRTLQSVGFMQASSQPGVRESPYSLLKLQEFSITTTEDEGDHPRILLEDIMPLLRIPSVTVFSCGALASNELPEEPNYILPTKKLRLITSGLSGTALNQLLGCCKNLEKLLVDYSYHDLTDDDFDNDRDYHRYFDGLQQVKGTLLSLKIEEEGNYWNSSNFCSEDPPLLDLAGFSRLQILNIPAPMLMRTRAYGLSGFGAVDPHHESDESQFYLDFAHLPGSLIQFTLYHISDHHLENITELDLDFLPNLKMLRISFSTTGTQAEANRIQSLNLFKMCKERGIVIQYPNYLGRGHGQWSAPEIPPCL